MKGKTITILLVVVQSVFLLNCKKESVSNTTAPTYMLELLTKDTLEFESYIIHWNTSTMDTLYRRGGNANNLNLDTAWFKFDKDGTYKAYLSLGYNYSASWQFLDNGSKLRLWNDVMKFDQEFTMVKLSTDTIQWVNPKLDNLFYHFSYK